MNYEQRIYSYIEGIDDINIKIDNNKKLGWELESSSATFDINLGKIVTCIFKRNKDLIYYDRLVDLEKKIHNLLVPMQKKLREYQDKSDKNLGFIYFGAFISVGVITLIIIVGFILLSLIIGFHFNSFNTSIEKNKVISNILIGAVNIISLLVLYFNLIRKTDILELEFTMKNISQEKIKNLISYADVLYGKANKLSREVKKHK